MNVGGAGRGVEPSMANSRRAIGSLGKIVAAVVMIAVATIGYALSAKASCGWSACGTTGLRAQRLAAGR